MHISTCFEHSIYVLNITERRITMNTSKPELTARNLAILNDQLGAEALLVHKFVQASQSVQDQTISSELSAISKQHRQHYDTLLNYLNSHQ